MRMQRIIAASIVGLLAIAVPGASQEVGLNNPENVSTPTSLYFHLNGFQDFPINTQKPDDAYAASEGIGLATHSTSCVPDVDAPAQTSKAWHTDYGYSSPGYVEYNFEQDGQPRYHPERGLSFDAILDTSAPFTLYWYLETSTGLPGMSPDPNSLPIVIPGVSVQATMRTGDSISVDDIGYNSGDIIASGKAGPAILAAEQSEGATYYADSERPVYEFAIPMEVQMDNIPRDTGYNLRIDVFIEDPAASGLCADPETGYVMPNVVKKHTSAKHRPRMELSVMNPIRIEFLHPQFLGDDLVIHTSANSPWGNYDVAETEGFFATPGGMELRIEGPSPATSLQQVAFTQRYHDHYFHQEAVDISYLWEYKKDGAKNGLYTVHFRVQNDQQTAEATGTAQFEIGSGRIHGCGEATEAAKANTNCKEETQPDGAKRTQDSPGAGLLAVFAALGAALYVARRR